MRANLVDEPKTYQNGLEQALYMVSVLLQREKRRAAQDVLRILYINLTSEVDSLTDRDDDDQCSAPRP